jgi:hypothetical protein
MRRLLEVLENPFSDSQEKSPFREPAPEGGELYQTFCGT